MDSPQVGKMDSPQSSVEVISVDQNREDPFAILDSLTRRLEGLRSEATSGTIFRDSSSSQKLGSAEFSSSGFSSSPPVFVDANSNVNVGISHNCSGCITKDSVAVAKCFDCRNFLCANCVMAHQFILCFEDHHIVILGEIANGSKSRNENEDLDALSKVISKGKIKAEEISKVKNLKAIYTRLSTQYRKAINEINETHQFYVNKLQERKGEIMKELELAFGSKQVALSVYGRKALETADKIYQVTNFGDRLLKHVCPSEVLLFKKPIEARLHEVLAYMPDINVAALTELEFVSNLQAIETGVKDQFGYVKTKQEVDGSHQRPPICPRSVGSSSPLKASPPSPSLPQTQDAQGNVSKILPIAKIHKETATGMARDPLEMARQHLDTKVLMPLDLFSSTTIKPTTSSLPGTATQMPSLFQGIEDKAIKWANGSDNIFSGLAVGPNNQLSASYSNSPITPIMSFPSTSVVNTSSAKSHINRQKMIYHCKFGEFGILEDQFTEPSGVAVNAQNDIIVADANNHKIKIFDKEGRFKFQFGEVGKSDGQLLYPSRVAVFKNTGDIVITERSPTHQVQIYTQYGQFIRKFGANILQHPRGVCVDNSGRVIVVECKVMSVIIFDQHGNLLNKFGCSQYLHFPNGVVVNDRQEIFISDNRAHCVKVFSYDGNFLRKIGGEGITNYPIGVGINAKGEITIADNHNNFNLTVFSQDGFLVSALESKVKHAQCYDVALTDDGSVVLASKDFKLYIYRYVQIPPGYGTRDVRLERESMD